MVTVIWVTRCNRSWMSDMGFGGNMEMIYYFILMLLLLRKPSLYLVPLLPLEVGHLKLEYGW